MASYEYRKQDASSISVFLFHVCWCVVGVAINSMTKPSPSNLLPTLQSISKMARRKRLFRYNNNNHQYNASHGHRHHPMGQPLLSYRTIVYVTISFCVVALLGLASHSFKVDGSATRFRRDGSQQLQHHGGSSMMFRSTDDIGDDVLSRLDAILVLGGGRPVSVDKPPVYVQRRCDDAAALVARYQALNKSKSSTSSSSSSPPILCLSAGTAHVPQLLSADGLPVWESTACAAYFVKQYPQLVLVDDDNKATYNDNADNSHNAPTSSSSKLYVETTSYDTIGNAYFARTGHTDVNGWRHLLVITNEFHMNRTAAIFDWIFGLTTTTTTTTASGNKQQQHQHDHNSPYRLYYLSSKNVGLTADALRARQEREAASLENVRRYAQTYATDLGTVYRFLTTQHALYTATKLVDRASSSSAQAHSSETTDLVKMSYGGGVANGKTDTMAAVGGNHHQRRRL